MRAKIYEVFFKNRFDGKVQVTREVIPAESKKKLLEQWGGNGEAVIVNDVSDEYKFDMSYLSDVLAGRAVGHWGEDEIDIIRRALMNYLPNDSIV